MSSGALPAARTGAQLREVTELGRTRVASGVVRLGTAWDGPVPSSAIMANWPLGCACTVTVPEISPVDRCTSLFVQRQGLRCQVASLAWPDADHHILGAAGHGPGRGIAVACAVAAALMDTHRTEFADRMCLQPALRPRRFAVAGHWRTERAVPDQQTDAAGILLSSGI